MALAPTRTCPPRHEYLDARNYVAKALLGVAMAKRRGFFAELQYQSQQAEKHRRQQAAATQRAYAAAQRESERASRAYERAQAAAARASVADQKAAEKEAIHLRVEARLAEVEELNANLAAQYADIDALLASTLEVDDYVDLAALKVTAVEHPPFEPGALALDTAAVPVPQRWAAPVWQEPAQPGGLGAALGGKKRHEKVVAEARAAFEAAYAEWARADALALDAYLHELAHRDNLEKTRKSKLAAAEAKYQEECKARDAKQRSATPSSTTSSTAWRSTWNRPSTSTSESSLPTPSTPRRSSSSTPMRSRSRDAS